MHAAELEGPLALEPGKVAMVWAYCCQVPDANGHLSHPPVKSVEEAVKKASQALVLVVRWQEHDPNTGGPAE
jgi:hypothetical protein